jgi:hypothetical protein
VEQDEVGRDRIRRAVKEIKGHKFYSESEREEEGGAAQEGEEMITG